MIKKIILILGFLFCVSAAYARAGDMCASKILTSSETIICSNPGLIWDDRKLNALYRLAKRLDPVGSRETENRQKGWLKDVRDHCQDATCMQVAYNRRNQALTTLVNALADPFPAASSWVVDFPADPDQKDCSDGAGVNFAQVDGKPMGVWRLISNCGRNVSEGFADVREEGRIFDLRIIGGHGPSYVAGVALAVRKGSRLVVASMFDRSTTGTLGDYDPFNDNDDFHHAKSTSGLGLDDHAVVTRRDLAEAWKETEGAAVENKSCLAGQDINVCIRRLRP